MNGKVFQPSGNFYDKYNTRNPIARAMMRGFLRSFVELATMAEPAGTAMEIGCGEGELSMRLAGRGWEVQGCDISEGAIAEARRRAAKAGLAIPFRTLDVFSARDACGRSDLVVCCEVMEHLEEPAIALDILAGLSRGYLLVSVPREPIWRALNMARGSYWKDFGNTPGHVQHWSKHAFVSLLQQRVQVVAVRSPLPWTLALCRVQ